MTVQAMKASAIEFLTKLFREQDLSGCRKCRLGRDRVRRENEKALSATPGAILSIVAA